MYIKFALTGTHSSGKTSLVNELIKFEEFKEFQFFTERTKYLRDSLKVSLNDDSKILSQYIFLGERAKELFVPSHSMCDRSVYDVMAYTLNAKSITSSDKHAFMYSTNPLIRHYDCIFYSDPTDIPIENNGLRDIDPLYREQINQSILDLIDAYPPNNLIKLTGSLENRTSIILKTLNKYL